MELGESQEAKSARIRLHCAISWILVILTLGIITAIGAIMSLANPGLPTYQIQWYDSLGGASVVPNYWMKGINEHIVSGTCGFVYESGDEDIGPGNHIHLPSDYRVLNSPEYVEWF
ncbi:MAG: hypothetical protein JSW61_10630 [Candidatus Thorarchaeota archaeon]|nr:MAG: hypothetical protein JSW61_10630 [Candidatus Thorarchaeota archaeon]